MWWGCSSARFKSSLSLSLCLCVPHTLSHTHTLTLVTFCLSHTLTIITLTHIMATFLPLSLRNYGLSAESGFLPSEPPVGRLADPYFEKWEELATDVPSRVKDMALFREQIEGMCVLDSSRIGAGDECSLRRAYVVLSVLGHAYVWGGGDEGVRDVLPKSIAVPWYVRE